MKNVIKISSYLLLAFIFQACNGDQNEIIESYDLKGNAKGSEILFTDEYFKDVLINTNCVDTNGDGVGDRNADENNDGEIQKKEANSIEALILEFQYEIPIRFTNLEGIENFSNLKSLVMIGPGGYFYEEEIVNTEHLKIDFTSLRKLEYLKIKYLPTDYFDEINLSGLNKLVKIDLSQNRPIDYYSDGNKFIKINMQGTSNLRSLDLVNSFLDIDFCQTPSLEILNMNYLEGGEPDVFDFHCLNKLKWLDISENKINTLILKNSSVLETLICKYIGSEDEYYNLPFPNYICIDDIPQELQQIQTMIGPDNLVTTDCTF